MSEDKKVAFSKPKQNTPVDLSVKGINKLSCVMLEADDLRALLDAVNSECMPKIKVLLEKMLEKAKRDSELKLIKGEDSESRQVKGEFTKKIIVKSSSTKRRSCNIV